MLVEMNNAESALFAIPSDISREEWVRVLMAANAAGLSLQQAIEWSSTASNFDIKACEATWRSIKSDGGIGPGTLFATAIQYGWKQTPGLGLQANNSKAQKILNELWLRGVAVDRENFYVHSKSAGDAPLDGLRELPTGDHYKLMGQSMAGALMVPVLRTDNSISSIQFIPRPEIVKKLKLLGNATKLNLPGCRLDGWFTVGKLNKESVVYLCEGIGTAWACWKATGSPAVVCFGWGRVAGVAREIKHQVARIVICPDVGKEASAVAIASEVGAAVASMPKGWPINTDFSDLGQREGFDVVEEILSKAIVPEVSPSRFRLISCDDLRKIPAISWRVKGVFPKVGLAAIYGPSGSGKSFLAFDLAGAIATGQTWFNFKVEGGPVVYGALEGESGVRLRAEAWEKDKGHKLPINLRLLMQPFKLTDTADIKDLASQIPSGAVLILDTLNRAAPMSDENSSRDMGEILEGAKKLQELINGLVLLIHHTGKNVSAGLRGHSSLFAALDGAIEVKRNGKKRLWQIAKSKDGTDGAEFPFQLDIVELDIDEIGEAVTSCVVSSEHSSQQIRSARVPRGENQKIIFDAIKSELDLRMKGELQDQSIKKGILLDDAICLGATKLNCQKDRRTTRAKEAIEGLVNQGIFELQNGCLLQQHMTLPS
jgi:putative DNA primase/helicase